MPSAGKSSGWELPGKGSPLPTSKGQSAFSIGSFPFSLRNLPSQPGLLGLHCSKSSDPLSFQWYYILPLKHFFKVYYETMWFWACQKFHCRIQGILSSRVAALSLENVWEQKTVIKPCSLGNSRVPSITEGAPSHKHPSFSFWPPSPHPSFRIQIKGSLSFQ